VTYVARRSDGAIVVWGDNSKGQWDVPVLPPGLSYVDITAGSHYTVARRSDGTVVAWGDDQYSQTHVPPAPGGLPSVRIDAFGLASVAIHGDDPCSGAQSFCVQTKPTSVPGCTATLEVDDCTLAAGVWSSTNIPRDSAAGLGTSIGIYVYTHGVAIGQSAFSSGVPYGTLCLQGFKRSSPACAPATLPGAQPGVCNSGAMTTAANCNGGALGLAVGEDVNVQLWYRDPMASSPGNANFSNAVFYTLH
jgi:hypothetical protein